MSSSSSAAQDRVLEALAVRGSALVAFSGGVDSAVVAALAARALGDLALAVTAAAETLSGRELDGARRLAREIGIAHEVVTYSELDDAEYVRNPAWRCYVCQGLRMGTMVKLARERGFAVVCDGTNASDPGPDRPGLRAVEEHGVWSPLLEFGIRKDEVRELARELGLSVAEKPANACLSSRIPHGQVVTLGKLRAVEKAEELLLEAGFEVVRVRHQTSAGGSTARIEVGSGEVERLRKLWSDLEPSLRACGFTAAELDPVGYRRGGADGRRDPVAEIAAR
ncbi:MAG: ATP-dependent sacrificial sulfur transferase LarE [Acidobacteriota bacterium]